MISSIVGEVVEKLGGSEGRLGLVNKDGAIDDLDAVRGEVFQT